MQNDWIFKIHDYRSALSRQIEFEGQNRGYKTLMARAAGCQPAYLSQVIAGQVQLTPEQASGLCDFWQMNEIESEYFLTLVFLGRSGRQELSERLERKLAQLIAEYERRKPSELQIDRHHYDRDKALFYYLDWVPSAVHLLLMIPGHDHPNAIAKRLRVEEGVILSTLRTLEELGIATKSEAKWALTARTLHAADESLFAPHHHRNWREKSMDYFRHGKKPDNFHYTSVYSLDSKAFQQIREELRKLVASSKRIVIPAPEQTIACMNLDWFEI